ncbi:hypothetical protein NH340_JMT08173 [Sarcoptes scabiei]|nr:hypothetical protein NH340_JMT08173 [Sarcoptes scabiei]
MIDKMSPSVCQVGLWSTPILNDSVQFPLKLRRLIRFKSSLSPSSKRMISNRNFILIVEILHRNSRKDSKNFPLISRQINHFNLEANFKNESESFYGGKIYAPISSTAIKLNPTDRRFRFRYRWHLKSLQSSHHRNDNDVDEPNEGQKQFFDNREYWNQTVGYCPDGYQGPDCSKPICLQHCHQYHGYCERPGECNCRFGWTGMFCQDCLTLPGCVHGVCHRPFECKCEEGWNGVFCSIPKCRDGCHSKNGYCTKPNECKCKLGWRGENCTECAVLPGCQHGSCTDPLDCDCEKGWQGTFCSQPICSEGCQNGWCLKPNECRCKIGFNGTNCDQCVPYPGCRNGHCQQNQPWTCECEPGWTDQLCDRRLNRCEDHQKQEEHRCLNGGTCFDVEEDDDLHYRCQCSEGFGGKNCELILREQEREAERKESTD